MAFADPDPSGAGVSVTGSSRWVNTSAGSYPGEGGNISNASLSGATQTGVWSGFVGEVTGGVTLNNANAQALFDWAVTSVTGEVFASRNSTPEWGNIAAQNDCTVDSSITGSGSDNSTNTWTASNNTAVQVGTTNIAAGSACALGTYVSGAAQSGTRDFEEILLTAGGTGNEVYTAKINEDTTGYDGSTHDYQMIVPDYSNSTSLTYYFFVELG
ncbi:hypothetical protein GF371_05575 [Candidatus Woesearchaeota archaeon]|nr:hypothetical protein [Candidatus Woesearchaeota archaeon]